MLILDDTPVRRGSEPASGKANTGSCEPEIRVCPRSTVPGAEIPATCQPHLVQVAGEELCLWMSDTQNMANPRFPDDISQSVGRFWVNGGDTSKASSGVCRVEPAGIEIEVSDPLTQWMEADHAPEGVTLRPAADLPDLVVHGALPFAPNKVTFLDARTVARRAVALPFGDVRDNDPQLHHLRADWCVAGAHIPSTSATFSAIRARFTHLEPWAMETGVDMTFKYKPSTEVTIKFVPPSDTEVPFAQFSENATLRLRTVGTLPPPTVWGGQIRTRNWLVLDGLSGWTLEETFARFVRPVQTLLTLLAGQQCEVLNFEVEVEDEWCPVFHSAIKIAASQPDTEATLMLLNREKLPLEIVAEWCGTATQLSPTPQVVSAAVAGTFQTVDAEALALTTTAEGMDRALNPNARRFTAAEVGAAVAALKGSEAPVNVRDAMISALNLYFYEDSYPTRMKRLASAVAIAAPDCVGRPSNWKDAMRKLRNELAHSLADPEQGVDDPLLLMHARARSLRWALQIRMLQVAGVSSDAIADGLEGLQRYQRDVRLWRRHLE